MAEIVTQHKEEAMRKRAADTATPVLERMILLGHRAAEARAALSQLQAMPMKPEADDKLAEPGP